MRQGSHATAQKQTGCNSRTVLPIWMQECDWFHSSYRCGQLSTLCSFSETKCTPAGQNICRANSNRRCAALGSITKAYSPPSAIARWEEDQQRSNHNHRIRSSLFGQCRTSDQVGIRCERHQFKWSCCSWLQFT